MPEDFDVIHQDAPAPVVPDKDKGKDENVTISRAELESLKRESQERAEAAQYWSNLHRQTRAAAEPAPEADEVDPREFLDEAEPANDDDTPEKLVNDLAAKGAAGLKARGFITAADAKRLAAEVAINVSRELIGRERQKITSDAQIMSEFPELKDQSSDLFKETAKIYQAAVAMDPSAKKTPAALFLAAKAAKASLKREAPARRTDDEEDDYRPESESERRQRARAQDSRPRGRGEVETDDMLGSEARQVIAAMGITEAEFKESQKAYGSAGRGRRR